MKRLNNILRQKESTLDELKSASGFVSFGSVNVEMLMRAWATLYLHCGFGLGRLIGSDYLIWRESVLVPDFHSLSYASR
jgi:hypothetical protein